MNYFKDQLPMIDLICIPTEATQLRARLALSRSAASKTGISRESAI